MLEFDYTNVLDRAVGPHGIPQSAFDKAMKSTPLLIDALESARTGGRLGFADLPFDEKPNFDSMGYLQNRTVAELFDAERRATEMAITEAGRPNATVYADRVSEESLGDLIMFSQYMTAYVGELYDIDAFDQPGVEYGTKLTFAMMGRTGFEKYNSTIEASRRRERAIVR